MKLRISLSEEGINKAISRLLEAQDNLEYGLNELVDILTKDGAEVARSWYGNMANVSSESDMGYGTIQASGEATVIAEFGAGDKTMPVLFENYPGVDVYPGAYSEQVGTGEYANTGRWHWGGNTFTEIEPRAGLYNAKEYIKANSSRIARSVIKL